MEDYIMCIDLFGSQFIQLIYSSSLTCLGRDAQTSAEECGGRRAGVEVQDV